MVDSGIRRIAVMGSMHEIGFFEGNINEKTFSEIMQIMNKKGSFDARIIPTFRCNDVLSCDLTPERLRLLIAISADGSLYQSGKFWRVRIIKERKIQRLRELIQAVAHRSHPY